MIIAEGRLGLRWYAPTDLDQLVDLHACCLRHEAWEAGDFVKFASCPTRRNVLKVLGGEDGVVYGSLLYTIEGDMACRFRRVCVWPDYRGQGLAKFMLNSVCGPRSPVRRSLFTARVRETNVNALCLFRGMGFTFDHTKPRERDKELNVDYYEFSYTKVRVPVTA